jgi:alpha-amylase/alpha-mannosidase (GH57 family)
VTSLIIHGHFYQPPRENPWTGAIDREDSARPFHDWNERIHAECYRPNAFARVVNSEGLVERIVNNYANLSFNFGPTLMSWLEIAHPDSYARVIEADRVSFRRHDAHGSAIAQGYNHAILPLCNERDRRTQIKWGIADFRHRFGRAPEALWLPETACNDATMGDLIEAGMKFVILSPHQAERTRPLEGVTEWRDVGDGSIDPRKPYRYFHRDGSGRSIAVFFYDDGVSRGIAFENLLWSSEALVDRLLQAAGDAPMVNIATDGESYGHHFKFGDRCLAYAFEYVAPQRGLTVTNYGQLLEQNPPVDEVEIKLGPNGEGTAWSCSHGVGRWYRNCGCSTGGLPGWTQEWRGPLRSAYDILRDRCAERFSEMAGDLLRDPWAARDGYIEVLLSRGAARDSFLDRHARRRLDDAERQRAMTLLEMQRHAMLMYTSCGWFFTELSGIETVQTMKYAARTLDLMETLGVGTPIESVLEVLAQARSNIAEMGNGADVFRRFIPQSRVTPKRIGAHMAISTIASQAGREGDLGDYHFQQEEFRQERHGRLLLATSRLALTEVISGRQYKFDSAALHLGGVDFYCALKDSTDPNRFREACARVWAHFRTASLPAMIRKVQEEFGPEEFGLEDVLADGRLAICEMIFGDVLEGLTDQFARLYEEYHRVVEMLQESGFEPPPQFRQLTEFTLGRRFEYEIVKQQRSRDPIAYRRAADIAAMVARRGYQIDKSVANDSFGAMINDAVARAVERPSRVLIKAAIDLIELSRRLGLEPNLDSAQEHVYDAFTQDRPHAGQLSRLASALQLSQSAMRRLRPHRHRAAEEVVSDGSADGRAPARPRRQRSSETRTS